MTQKKLKYAKHLESFPNCPPEHYIEVDMNASRWVHSVTHTNDFSPRNIISDPPPRMLDKTDLLCKGFGLSLFDTICNAFSTYEKQYSKRREHLKKEFVDEYGDSIAELKLCKSDGLAGDFNDATGHFTFHEYENIDLASRIISVFNIFDANGEFKQHKTN